MVNLKKISFLFIFLLFSVWENASFGMMELGAIVCSAMRTIKKEKKAEQIEDLKTYFYDYDLAVWLRKDMKSWAKKEWFRSSEQEKLKKFDFNCRLLDWALGYPNATALHIACLVNNKELVKFLIKKGVNVNECDLSGLRPIDCAYYKDNKKIIKLLIKNGAKPVEDENSFLKIMIERDRAIYDGIRAQRGEVERENSEI